MVEFLATNPWLTVSANLAGVIGFGLAFFFYFRGKERFSLSYTVEERLLVQSSSVRPFDIDVPLSWQRREVLRLTRSFILIKNTGNKLIEQSDLVDMPTIRVGEASSILEAVTVFSDDPGSRFAPSGDGSAERPFDFKFLRPGDGVILKVDHTGVLNEVFVDCTTKAGGQIKKANPNIAAGIWAAVAMVVVFCIGNVAWRHMTFSEEMFNYHYPTNDSVARILGSFVFGTAITLVLLIVYGLIRFVITKLSGSAKAQKASEIWLRIGANAEVKTLSR